MKLDGVTLSYESDFRYLGYYVSVDYNDDEVVEKQTRRQHADK